MKTIIIFCLAGIIVLYKKMKRYRKVDDLAVFIEGVDEIIKRYEIIDFYNENFKKAKNNEKYAILNCIFSSDIKNEPKIYECINSAKKRVGEVKYIPFCKLDEYTQKNGDMRYFSVFKNGKIIGYVSFLPIIDFEKKRKIYKLKKYGVKIYFIDNGISKFAVKTAKKAGIVKKHDLIVTGKETELLNTNETNRLIDICTIFVNCTSYEFLINAINKKFNMYSLDNIDLQNVFKKYAVSFVESFILIADISFGTAFLTEYILNII